MDRGAWWATVHGVAEVRYNLAIKPPPLQFQTRYDLNHHVVELPALEARKLRDFRI